MTWNAEEAKGLRGLLESYWPGQLNDARWELWTSSVGRYPAPIVAAVVKDFATSKQFLPLLSEVGELARARLPNPEPAAPARKLQRDQLAALAKSVPWRRAVPQAAREAKEAQ